MIENDKKMCGFMFILNLIDIINDQESKRSNMSKLDGEFQVIHMSDHTIDDPTFILDLKSSTPYI